MQHLNIKKIAARNLVQWQCLQLVTHASSHWFHKINNKKQTPTHNVILQVLGVIDDLDLSKLH